MREHSIGDLRFVSYRLFEPFSNLTNVFTTRAGGRSKPPYASLNLGLHVGDDADAVLENRAAVAQALGIQPESFTLPEQMHGADVAVVGEEERGRGAIADSDQVLGCDALVTSIADVPLMVLVADCVALSFYDPENRVIGLAHAGWKGTLGRIAERTVAKMREAFGSKESELRCGISASIGRGHYDVGEDVFGAFRKEFGRRESSAFLQEDMDGTCYLDLWEANSAQLQGAGVTADHIASSEMCTACHPDRFYSHRHDDGRTGRFGAIMMLHGLGTRQY